MTTLSQAGHALQIGFGLALVAALALVNGCASGVAEGESGQSDDLSNVEVKSALAVGPTGIFTCSIGGGRSLSSLQVFSGPLRRNACSITSQELPGSSRIYCTGSFPFMICPDCQDLRSSLACFSL